MADQTYRDTTERLQRNWDCQFPGTPRDLIDQLEEINSGEKIILSGIERDVLIYALAAQLKE